VRRRRWTHWQQCRPVRHATRNGWLEGASRGRFGTARAVQLLLESRLQRLWLWQKELADLAAITESFLGPFGLEEECRREAVSIEDKTAVEQAELSEFQQFAIDPGSARIVADGRIYTISGSVTGPAVAHARIRVWLGDPVAGFKRRDPTLGTEILVSGSLIVDLPQGYNSFSFVLDSFQLPANIPQPPSAADPWVLTASATSGEAESDPVLLPPPEYGCATTSSLTVLNIDAARVDDAATEAPEPPTITSPPEGGVAVGDDATYEIEGFQAPSSAPLLIQAWHAIDNAKIVDASSFATVLEPGETQFSVLVKLLPGSSNRFVVSATDLTSGFESAPAAVPNIRRKEKSFGGRGGSRREELLQWKARERRQETGGGGER
jgi:hypothetical protein